MAEKKKPVKKPASPKPAAGLSVDPDVQLGVGAAGKPAPKKQALSNVTAQRVADALGESGIGVNKYGLAIIDAMGGVVALCELAHADLNGSPDHVARFRTAFAKCLRIVADQIGAPDGPPPDPLTFHVPHSSSNVTSSSYDPDRLILEVLYNNGGKYHYSNVPRQVRDAMMASESVGSFIAKSVKPVYPCQKVN